MFHCNLRGYLESLTVSMSIDLFDGWGLTTYKSVIDLSLEEFGNRKLVPDQLSVINTGAAGVFLSPVSSLIMLQNM